MYEKPFGSISLTTQNHFETHSRMRDSRPMHDNRLAHDVTDQPIDNPNLFAPTATSTNQRIETTSLSTIRTVPFSVRMPSPSLPSTSTNVSPIDNNNNNN